MQKILLVQEGTIGLFHNSFLCPADFVPLLHVWDCPGLLDLTQLLQPIIETLSKEKLTEHPVCNHIFTLSLMLFPPLLITEVSSSGRSVCPNQPGDVLTPSKTSLP